MYAVVRRKMSYFVSLGYLHDGDIFNTTKQEDFDPSFSYRRYNWRSNFDSQYNKVPPNCRSMWPVRWGIRTNRLIMRMLILRMSAFLKTFFTAPSNEFPIKYSKWNMGGRVKFRSEYSLSDERRR